MQCQPESDDIEMVEEGGYVLDNVMCADGQYDLDLDQNLEVTNRRAE